MGDVSTPNKYNNIKDIALTNSTSVVVYTNVAIWCW